MATMFELRIGTIATRRSLSIQVRIEVQNTGTFPNGLRELTSNNRKNI